MAERGILATLIILLVVLIFVQPDLAWPVRSFLGPSGGPTDVQRLDSENISLRADLGVLRERGAAPRFPGGITASVYVRYPFNFKNQLLLDVGRNMDVKEGSAVIIGDGSDSGILLGRIESVEEKSSIVQTIFDARFQMGVRIGESGVESLLEGGGQPKLTLIPKNAEIRAGDIVFSAAPHLPYGLAVGEVKDTTLASGGLLQEATLRLPYDLNRIRTVEILP